MATEVGTSGEGPRNFPPVLILDRRPLEECVQYLCGADAK